MPLGRKMALLSLWYLCLGLSFYNQTGFVVVLRIFSSKKNEQWSDLPREPVLGPTTTSLSPFFYLIHLLLGISFSNCLPQPKPGQAIGRHWKFSVGLLSEQQGPNHLGHCLVLPRVYRVGNSNPGTDIGCECPKQRLNCGSKGLPSTPFLNYSQELTGFSGTLHAHSMIQRAPGLHTPLLPGQGNIFLFLEGKKSAESLTDLITKSFQQHSSSSIPGDLQSVFLLMGDQKCQMHEALETTTVPLLI